jgi:uncharacterized membrane protein
MFKKYGMAIVGLGFYSLLAKAEVVSVSVTFKDVQPILEKRCAGCHVSPTGTLDFADYETAVRFKDDILLKVVELRSMPLYRRMPESERQLIRQWIEQGCAQELTSFN